MALAKSELEYLEGHISRSVYVIFKVVNIADIALDFLKGLLPSLVWLSGLQPHGQFLQMLLSQSMVSFFMQWSR